MCRSKRRQRFPQQDPFHPIFTLSVQGRGCCGARKQRNLLREVEARYQSSDITQAKQDGSFLSAVRSYHCTMAGILAVSIGLGAEKLGRKISDKRLERKEKKAAEVCFTLEVMMCRTKCWRRSETTFMDMPSPPPRVRHSTARWNKRRSRR
jgi:hypothetical protein